MVSIRALTFGIVFACLSTLGHAADIRPGLWEFRSTHLSMGGLPDMSSQMAQMQQQLKNLPPEMRQMVERQMVQRGVTLNNDGTVRSCITPEQAREDSIFSGKMEGNCTLTNVVKTGTTVRGRVICTDPQGVGDFEARLGGAEHFTTRVNMKSARGDMQMETEARWVGAQCAPVQGVVPRGMQ